MKKLTLNYASVLGFFDIIFGSLWAYAAVYMLSKGMSESIIGIFFGLSYLLATILQPVFANQADKSVKWTLYEYVASLYIPAFILLILLFFDLNVWLTAIFYFTFTALLSTIAPLISSMGMTLVNNGLEINYGLCRSAGSLIFSLTSYTTGQAIERIGLHSIIWIGLFGMIVFGMAVYLLNKNYYQPVLNRPHTDLKLNVTDIALDKNTKFIKKYNSFVYVVVGAFFFYVSHAFIANFLIRVVNNVGGDTQNMGLAIMIGSLSEIPAMILYGKFAKRIGHANMLFISGIFFMVKNLMLLFVTTLTGIYIAQTAQFFSFGFFIVASAFYPNQIMHSTDKVKGQAYIISATTLGSVLGLIFGGVLIDMFSVDTALIFTFISTLIGIVCFTIGLIIKRPKAISENK